MAAPMPEVAGVEHRYAEVNGFRMHYAEAGEGEPVILQHGWPQHWYAWRHQIGPLAERYRVIVPDLRGYGWSEAPRSGYEKLQFAADVVALMDELGIERARFAGHDWGGVAAFLLGLEFGERFERIAALAVPGPWRQGPPPPIVILGFATYQSLIASPVLGGLAIRNGFPGRLLERARKAGEFSEDELRIYRETIAHPGHDSAMVQTYRTFLTRELPRSLRGPYDDRRIEVPTMLMIGGSDLIRKAVEADLYAERIDSFRYEVLDGAGHWLPEERPDAVTELLLDFFAAGAAAGATP